MKAVKSNENAKGRVEVDSALPNVSQRKINPLSPPTTLEVRGIQVHFPFKPYKCQEAYMEKVMDALLRSENALLESPTGTGKTLCLLCATLAWQREQSRQLHQASELTINSNGIMASQDGPIKAARLPTIVYASRTHSQLSQVVRELRNTRYRPTHAVLGSREQMCVNPKVKKEHSTASDINYDCNKLGKERRCRFRNNLEGFVPPRNEEGAPFGTQPVMDMEDLIAMGKQRNICPFYYTRSNVERAELVLVPYNYLFDKDARSTTLADIPWDNAVVIFDEAHNLESFASESASFDLSNTDIAGCVAEVNRAINYAQATPEGNNFNLKLDNLLRLKAIFLKLEDFIVNLSDRSAYSGEFMVEIFRQGAGINHANHEIMIEEIRKVNEMIMDFRGTGANKGSPKLEHFIQCLKRVFGHQLESRCLAKASFYRVHVSPKSTGNKNGRTISYWCFAPSLAMEELQNLNIRSILVTSGTLSPLPSYGMELGLNFPHTLENPHIIADHQVHVRVIAKGVSGKLLTSSFERRKDEDYYTELGNTLVSLAKITPMGMLVFFPSYGVMETCLEKWGGPSSSRNKKLNGQTENFFAFKRKQNTSNQFCFPRVATSFYDSGALTPWKRLVAAKAVVLEPKSSTELPDAIAEFKRFLELPKTSGAVLMGVCRGKISEGIDFSQDMSRAVVITGLPFPPSHDPKVKLKREYLDGTRAVEKMKKSSDGGFGGESICSSTTNKLSGHDWYTQQAHRAVNQAIGRVIRNKSDYGAVLLLDSRFDQRHNQIGLSKWLRPHVRKDEGFGTAIRTLVQFFKDAERHTRALQEASINATPSTTITLEYEEEMKPLAPIFTKVAFIRSNEDNMKETKDLTASESVYVPPERIVRRVDIEEGIQNNSKIVESPPIDTQANLAINEAAQNNSTFFKPKLDETKERSNKVVAFQLMKKMKQNLSPEEQSSVRKASVAMKEYGEKGDSNSYLRCANDVLTILARRERFEDTDVNERERTMVFCFLNLQPTKFRPEIELACMKLLFDNSSLSVYCKSNLATVDFGRGRLLTSNLLHLVWLSDKGKELCGASYAMKAERVVKILTRCDKKIAPALIDALCKLLPLKFVSPTQALAQELSALKRVELMKLTEKAQKGRAPLEFQQFRTTALKTSSEPLSSIDEHASKRMRVNENAVPLLKSSTETMKAPPTHDKVEFRKSDGSSRTSLSNYLKALESSSPFVKLSSEDVTMRLKSNAPLNATCPICSRYMEEPFLANCGHLACLGCWLGWLQRSESCPTCRQPATKDQLAKAVFTDQQEAVSPRKLARIVATGESDEDELEIS